MLAKRTAVHRLVVIAAWLVRLCSALEFNTSGANSVKFPDSPTEKLFTQITTDLHRFTKTGIHLDMIEQPYCSEREPSRLVAHGLFNACLYHLVGNQSQVTCMGH